MPSFVNRRDLVAMAAGGLAAGLLAGPNARVRAADQQVTVYVLPGALPGPDGKGHDSFVPSTFAVKSGAAAQLEIVNYDTGAHTITAPTLNLNIQIAPAKKDGGKVTPVATTYTLPPTKVGTYRWYCALQCDGPSHWAMDQGYGGPGKEGYMAGFIVAI